MEIKKLTPRQSLIKAYLRVNSIPNDSNTLDNAFYAELLHIIGLTEIKSGSKKLIERKKECDREPGSLIENTILQLDSHDKISRLPEPMQFGKTHAERLLNVSLELTITWLNRILFLKLLEAQLISYQKGDPEFGFLNASKVNGYDDLDKLFFWAMARKPDERNFAITQLFGKVPYLNSSLFEPTELEQVTIFISNLEHDTSIHILSPTVLKDNTGKKRKGSNDIEIKDLKNLVTNVLNKNQITEKTSFIFFLLMVGSEIKSFVTSWKGEYLNYGNWLAEPRTTEWFDPVPRIIIREVMAKEKYLRHLLTGNVYFPNSRTIILICLIVYFSYFCAPYQIENVEKNLRYRDWYYLRSWQ